MAETGPGEGPGRDHGAPSGRACVVQGALSLDKAWTSSSQEQALGLLSAPGEPTRK